MLIKNGYLVNPLTNTSEFADIRVENGIICEIGRLSAFENEEILDITGLTIAPGLIDTHIHFRDPGFTYKEDLHTGSLSAAKGGFTSVICMANTKPVVDNVETLTDILERAKQEDINIYQVGAVSYGFKGEELTDFEALAPYLNGPSAIAVSTDDATAPARILAEFAKKAKNFAEADAIRDELLAKGITLLDTREGTKFTIA